MARREPFSWSANAPCVAFGVGAVLLAAAGVVSAASGRPWGLALLPCALMLGILCGACLVRPQEYD